MAGFFKRLFGGGSEPAPARILKHPRDLRAGDIIRFGFMDFAPLSGQSFEVTDVDGYRFGGKLYPEFLLKNEEGTRLYLSVEEDDQDEDFLAISRKLKRKDVNALFDPERFGALFEDKQGRFELTRQSEPERLAGWTAPRYFLEVDRSTGSFRSGDPRQGGVGSWEEFDHYMLLGEEEERFIEIEVYDGNDTEIYAGMRLPTSKIDEMWPG